MRKFSFIGGIYPPERKELSKDFPITNAFPSTKKVCIPITMGGSPNTPVVKVGDVVKKGQIIADGDGPMSVPVHASVAGKVTNIALHLGTGNIEKMCVVIEANDSGETDFMPPLDPFTCDKKTALERIRNAGIVGMGGASFPTHVKLNPPDTCKIDTVILNAAECEPYLTIDERTLIESTAKVIDGLNIVLSIVGGNGIVALESNKAYIKDAIQAEIDKAGLSEKICIKIVKTKYPQGCEKTLTKALLGREIPARGLPANIGCIICNVGTVCAISDAFRLGLPLIERPLTLSGGAVEEAKNLRVPVGTMVGDLIPEVIQLKSHKQPTHGNRHHDTTLAKIISGGPMMGFAMTNAMFPIEKGTSGVTFLTPKETYLDDEYRCISCGNCIQVCPMRLAPSMIARALYADDIEKAARFGLMDCIECGCCSYVCPGHIRLVQRFRVGKQIEREKKKQHFEKMHALMVEAEKTEKPENIKQEEKE